MHQRSKPAEPRHPTRVVTRRTGLSADLLRAWERRYAVVKPTRSVGGHRLYSDVDIERLDLLYRATIAGHSIGLVAAIPDRALAALLRKDAIEAAGTELLPAHGRKRAVRLVPVPSHAAAEFLNDCLLATGRMNAAALAATLRRAAVALHATEFLDELVIPLLKRVGTGWHPGTLPPVHGHLARAVLRRLLDGAIADATAPGATANVVIGTPFGEFHEFDALLSALSAAIEGWRVTYLGTNLPAEHIAEAATLTRARAVALSVEHPVVDPALGDEFRRLRRALPRRVTLMVGGAASSAYRSTLDEIGAIRPAGLAGLRSQLRTLRRA